MSVAQLTSKLDQLLVRVETLFSERVVKEPGAVAAVVDEPSTPARSVEIKDEVNVMLCGIL